VSRLTEELEAEIVDRQAEASERRVVLTKLLAKLADERGKLLQAFYANAIPLELLKTEQDRIGVAEQAARGELKTTDGDLDGWQDVLRTAIRLAGNCHAAYLKARPSVRRRFNGAVLEAVYMKDRKIGRAEFSEVFAPLFSRPSSNKGLKVTSGLEPPTSGRRVARDSWVDVLLRASRAGAQVRSIRQGSWDRTCASMGGSARQQHLPRRLSG
jgi:hypothetical protein